jgi:hypothetical protein
MKCRRRIVVTGNSPTRAGSGTIRTGGSRSAPLLP